MTRRRIVEFGATGNGPRNEHWEVAPGITCIKLTQGKFALVDTATLALIAGMHWIAVILVIRKKCNGTSREVLISTRAN